jgi:hypothetical protein
VRHANYIQLIRAKQADHPRYIKDCNLGVLLRWESASAEAIDAKARDITTKLSEANDQLPIERRGIVHIGFDALEGDEVERARHQKIIERAQSFDPRGTSHSNSLLPLFRPGNPTRSVLGVRRDDAMVGIRPTGPHPLGDTLLVLPNDGMREGPHWR